MAHPLYPHLSQLQKELPVLDLSRVPPTTPSFEAYRDYYRLDFEDTQHFRGVFSSGGYKLAANVFVPPEPKGTVFLVHGYFDHTGLLGPLIQNCLDQQLVVAVYDLPGHGLSSGEQASIGDFDEYVEILKDFFQYCRTYLPAPYHIISHSTGSSIVLEYLTQVEEQPFSGIVFLAPLVRSAYWQLSKFGYILGKPFRMKTVPRRKSAPSSNPEFVEFAKADPLQATRVPLRWVGEMYEWNEEIHDMDVLELPLLIIQGTDDSVVDWDYNIEFFQEKVRGVSVELIQDAEHQLFNEPPAIQAQVFHWINEYLEERR